MKRRIPYITALLLFSYVLAGAFVEVTHNHRHDIPLFAQHAFASHDCGAHERHVPLGKIHDCLACTHSNQRAAVEVVHHPILDPSFVCLTAIPIVGDRPLETDVLYSGKRGPPHA